MARPTRERSSREYLRKTPVFNLTTKYSDEIAETPLNQRALRPAAWPLPLVGGGKYAFGPGFWHAGEHQVTGGGATAKPKARQHLASRYDRRRERDRRMRFREAVAFAYAMDWPLNIGLTITWTALQSAGEHNEGHCLGRGEWDREAYTRDELARMCHSEGLPYVALWGRDVGADMGSHVHLSMFWPSYKLAKLVAVIERISGSSADFVLKPYAADVVARSVCGGWQINLNSREDDKASALEWADYIAVQHAKHAAPPEIEGKAFGISQAIGNAAQERARPMLEARVAWMRG